MSSTIVAQSAIPSNHIGLSWEDMASGNFPDSPWRQAFRQAVAEVAAKAKEVLTESHGRINSAVKMVLAGDVKLLEDGSARVASQSNGQTVYHLVNGECTCKDFSRAPGNFCKHRLGFGICKRASALAQERLTAQANGTPQEPQTSTPQKPMPAPEAAASPSPAQGVSLTPLPEAAASMNCYVTIANYRVQVTLRGDDETHLLARLEAFLQRFPTPDEAPPATITPPDEPIAPEGWCRRHNLQMPLQRSKDPSKPGTWWSHRLADGTWCRGK